MKKNIASIIVSVFGIVGMAVAAPLYIGDGVSTIGVSGTNEWTGSANWSTDPTTPYWTTWVDGEDAIINNTSTNTVTVNISSPVTVNNLAFNASKNSLYLKGVGSPTLTINGMLYTVPATPRTFNIYTVNLAGNMVISNISNFILESGTTVSPGTQITIADANPLKLNNSASDWSGLTVRLNKGGTLQNTLVGMTTVGTVTGYGILSGNHQAINNLSIDKDGLIGTIYSSAPVTLGSGTHTFHVNSASGITTADKLGGVSNLLGGTLSVQIQAGSDALKSGDVFTLFSGTNSGGFSSYDLPALDPSLSWGTDLLVSRGLLYVTDGTFTPPPSPPPSQWSGLPVFSDNFTDVTTGGSVLSNLRGWIATGVPYWSTSAGVSNGSCFFLRSTSSMSRLVDITSFTTYSSDFHLKFDCWVEATTVGLTDYVAITTDSGVTWTNGFSLALASPTNIDYDLGGYTGPYFIDIDTTGWTAGQLSGFGFRFSQTSSKAADHFNVDNVVLSVQTNLITTYALTVSSGSGSGSYAVGQQVPITASNLFAKTFVAWVGDVQFLDNATSATATVTMPAQAVSLTATYVDITYALTVTSGSNSGPYTNGQQVAIEAGAIGGKTFVQWTGDTAYLADSNSSSTTVTMPAQTVSLTATYKDAAPQSTTNGTPYSWLDQYGLTNYVTDAVLDQDNDGLLTWQEYIAGTDPTNSASCLKAAQTTRNIITWIAQSNRIYSVYWSTNLVKGFANLQDNITLPQSSYTNTTPDGRVNLYQIKVRLP
ncbi:MAG: hypothetical protein WCI73_12245 [Phycisphaerae bacterium]